jgi:CDP-diacylglycerol--glycerol-3-phosphate 3-phosphatidyltransferase
LLKQLPNALTLTRLILAPVIAWLLWASFDLLPNSADFPDHAAYFQEVANTLTLAAALFVVAALTDLFDGMLARALDAHSKFGRLIDPIADKALVGLPLLAIAFGVWQRGASPDWFIIAAATTVIVGRDVLMTVVRLAAPDGEGARVSSLAKWKTALELIVVGSFLVVSSAGMQITAISMYTPVAWARDLNSYDDLLKWIWMGLLVLAASLSAYTAWQYLGPKPKSRA